MTHTILFSFVKAPETFEPPIMCQEEEIQICANSPTPWNETVQQTLGDTIQAKKKRNGKKGQKNAGKNDITEVQPDQADTNQGESNASSGNYKSWTQSKPKHLDATSSK